MLVSAKRFKVLNNRVSCNLQYVYVEVRLLFGHSARLCSLTNDQSFLLALF